MTEKKFAVYIVDDNQIKKDGHVMMLVDISKELNRKSHLEFENAKLKEKMKALEQFYLMPKNATVGVVSPFYSIPSVLEGEYTPRSFYQEWASEQCRNEEILNS